MHGESVRSTRFRARSGTRSWNPCRISARRPVSRLPGVGADGAVVVKVVSGQSEAEVVCGLLRSAGIECGFRDTEAIDTPLEDFMAAGAQEILVHESDLAAAKELLEAT